MYDFARDITLFLSADVILVSKRAAKFVKLRTESEEKSRAVVIIIFKKSAVKSKNGNPSSNERKREIDLWFAFALFLNLAQDRRLIRRRYFQRRVCHDPTSRP